MLLGAFRGGNPLERIVGMSSKCCGEISPQKSASVYECVRPCRPPALDLSASFLLYGSYGPTPPLWQSEQFTAVRSPRSTGCLKIWAGNAATCVPLSCCSSTVWQELQSLLMTLPSL